MTDMKVYTDASPEELDLQEEYKRGYEDGVSVQTCLQAPKFAALFYEELEKEAWGRLDPYWFKVGSDPSVTEDGMDLSYGIAIIGPIQRALEKLQVGKQ